ncbi:MAG TPA: glycosyltransferase [bacterium]|nr:glycosyltransferase [bacterium]
MKILFLVNSLGGGGAEKVLVNLVNNIDRTRYDITIQTLFNAGINRQYLQKGIRLIESGWKSFRGVSLFFKIMPARILYKLFIENENYDLMVAYLHGAPTKILAGCPDKNIKKIAWLHIDMQYSSLGRIFFSRKQIIRIFDIYDRIVGVSATVSESFKKIYGLDKKIVTRYNTNNVQQILELSKITANDFLFPQNNLNIITLGRLAKQKGYERLLRISRKLLDEGLRFNLFILGKGPEQDKLERYIEKNSLSDNIKLLGFKVNPYPYLKKADLFVCSSLTEGLSTVISEAIILGVPVISTRVSGAEEVLGNNNEYGVLVENSEEALYLGMKELIINRDRISFYRERARERAAFFDTMHTVREVEALMEEVAG